MVQVAFRLRPQARRGREHHGSPCGAWAASFGTRLPPAARRPPDAVARGGQTRTRLKSAWPACTS